MPNICVAITICSHADSNEEIGASGIFKAFPASAAIFWQAALYSAIYAVGLLPASIGIASTSAFMMRFQGSA